MSKIKLSRLRHTEKYATLPPHAPVAQLDRVPASEAVGCGFNSRRVHLNSYLLGVYRLLTGSSPNNGDGHFVLSMECLKNHLGVSSGHHEKRLGRPFRLSSLLLPVLNCARGDTNHESKLRLTQTESGTNTMNIRNINFCNLRWTRILDQRERKISYGMRV